MAHRDSEASAPAEFPPEQPEADLAADEEDYGADEAAEDEEEATAENGIAEAVNGEEVKGEDSAMAGVDETAENGADEDELSDEGSEDIEGESEDEMEEEEEEGEGEGEAAGGDEMEVDTDVKADAAHPAQVASH